MNDEFFQTIPRYQPAAQGDHNTLPIEVLNPTSPIPWEAIDLVADFLLGIIEQQDRNHNHYDRSTMNDEP